MDIIEPGSLDLDQATLRVGGVMLSDDREILVKGNKFIVVEHFVDHEGNPVDEKRFDVTTMCYSILWRLSARIRGDMQEFSAIIRLLARPEESLVVGCLPCRRIPLDCEALRETSMRSPHSSVSNSASCFCRSCNQS